MEQRCHNCEKDTICPKGQIDDRREHEGDVNIDGEIVSATIIDHVSYNVFCAGFLWDRPDRLSNRHGKSDKALMYQKVFGSEWQETIPHPRYEEIKPADLPSPLVLAMAASSR